MSSPVACSRHFRLSGGKLPFSYRLLADSLDKQGLASIVKPAAAASLTQSALWYAGLSAVWGGQGEKFGRRLFELARSLSRELLLAGFTQQRQPVSVGIAIASVMALCCGEQGPRLPAKVKLQSTASLTHADHLRAWQMVRGAATRYPIEVDASLLRVGSLAFFRSAVASRGGAIRPISDRVLAELRALAGASASSTHARLTLDRLGALTDAMGTIVVTEASEDGRHLLRGCRPELYAPLRACLRPVPDAAIAAFAGLAAARHPLTWPSELTPRRLTESLELERERWLATLVVHADRFSLLTLLLRAGDNQGAMHEMRRMLTALNKRIATALEEPVGLRGLS